MVLVTVCIGYCVNVGGVCVVLVTVGIGYCIDFDVRIHIRSVMKLNPRTCFNVISYTHVSQYSEKNITIKNLTCP